MIKTTVPQAITQLQRGLKDLEDLNSKLYPAIVAILEDLGYENAQVQTARSAVADAVPDLFEISTELGTIDVKFASQTATGDYYVAVYDTDGDKIDSQTAGRPDLLDIIESYLFSLKGNG